MSETGVEFRRDHLPRLMEVSLETLVDRNWHFLAPRALINVGIYGSARWEGRALTELKKLSDRWFQAWLQKDAAVIERLAADDYIYVAPTGATLDRQAILAIIRSPSYRLDQGNRTEIVVRTLGESAAVVRHRYQGAGSFEGTSFTDDQRCVMVWENRDGEWQLVMEQCSLNTL
jgi:uncharacterized protein (TIGR02246 family)